MYDNVLLFMHSLLAFIDLKLNVTNKLAGDIKYIIVDDSVI